MYGHPMKIPDLTIRKAKSQDASLLSIIAHDAKNYWKYPKKLMKLWKKDLTITPGFIATHLVRCAIVETSIIGFYALSYNHSHFELEHLWISPVNIGKGAGSQLFGDAQNYIARQGGGLLEIKSDPHAEEFYLKKGAQRISQVPSKPAGRTLPLLQIKISGFPYLASDL